jgi:hypothetical protein
MGAIGIRSESGTFCRVHIQTVSSSGGNGCEKRSLITGKKRSLVSYSLILTELVVHIQSLFQLEGKKGFRDG